MKFAQSSDTAKLIARSLLLASRDRRMRVLVPDGVAEVSHRLITGGGQKNWIASALKYSGVRACLLGMERCLLPGIITHYLVRKLSIERLVRQKIADGCKRLVVLGAGYDSLTWRLHEIFPEVEFVELDHPATQTLKKRVLSGASNICFRAIDLCVQEPSSVIDSAPGATAFVAEGLTMYLSAERVAALLADLSALTGKEGSVVFTLMEKSTDGSIRFRGENPLISRWLKARSEPFLWGASRSELPEILGSSHLALTNLTDHEDLRRDYLQPHGLEYLPLAEGEIICEAAPSL